MADTNKGEMSAAGTGDAGSNPPQIKNDIQKILQDVKLPERRTPAPEPKQIPITVPPLDAPISATEAAPLPATAPKKEESSVVPLHTFKDDLQSAVTEQRISLVRAASMEADKKSFGGKLEPAPGALQRGKRVSGILFASAILILLGCAALFGVYFVMQGGSSQEETRQQQFPSLVFAESSILFPIQGVPSADLRQGIASMASGNNAALGSITRIIPTITSNPVDADPETRAATTGEFLRALTVRVPDELTRALSDEFFLGIHTVDTNAVVLVIPVLAYDRAFAGMLQWERTVNADLTPIFPSVSPFKTNTDGVPQDRIFTDTVMRNYDTRTLTDDAGNIVLYYSFPTPRLLIIAESPYTFAEILSRLQSQERL